MRISARVTGADRAERRLEGIARRSRDLRPAWDPITDLLLQRERRAFDRGGSGLFRRWKGIKPQTVERKKRRGDPQPTRILHGTGRLERSLTSKRAPGQVHRPTRDSLQFGTNVYYAGWQADQGRNPVGPLSRRDQSRAARILVRHIVRGDQ